MNAIDRHHLDPITHDRLTGSLVRLVEHAVQVQGREALSCTRRQAAYHEAGHCIAHHTAGDRIREVKVFPRGEHWLGFTRAGQRWDAGPHTDPRADLTHARIYIAGPLAEIAFSGTPALAAGADEIVLAQGLVSLAAVKLGTDAQSLMQTTIAETFCLLSDHRRALDELATLLQRQRKLPGERVTAIFRRHAVGSSAIARRAGSKRAKFG